MEAWISVRSGEPACGLRELATWLGEEPTLRGRVRSRAARRWRGELGTPYGVLIADLGHGGTVGALAGSLHAYLARTGEAGLRISVSSAEGRCVELADQPGEEVEALLRGALEAADEAEGLDRTAAGGVLAS